jgi:hypothetical protein
VNVQTNLKLVVLYNARANEYTIASHNLTEEQARELVAQQKPEDSSPLVLDQRARHRTEDTNQCRACRETVARTSQLEPRPKFKRRKT